MPTRQYLGRGEAYIKNPLGTCARSVPFVRYENTRRHLSIDVRCDLRLTLNFRRPDKWASAGEVPLRLSAAWVSS
jgi:hypothetical protein